MSSRTAGTSYSVVSNIVLELVIGIKKNQFDLPEDLIKIQAGELVRFIVLSEDMPYKFGVFHEDGTMAFQMQVFPAYSNSIIWGFSKPGKYSIRCREYGKLDIWRKVREDAIEVA